MCDHVLTVSHLNRVASEAGAAAGLGWARGNADTRGECATLHLASSASGTWSRPVAGRLGRGTSKSLPAGARAV